MGLDLNIPDGLYSRDIRIVDVGTELPEAIINGYESNFLPNVDSMIYITYKVEIRTVGCFGFDYMWEVLGQSPC